MHHIRLIVPRHKSTRDKSFQFSSFAGALLHFFKVSCQLARWSLSSIVWCILHFWLPSICAIRPFFNDPFIWKPIYVVQQFLFRMSDTGTPFSRSGKGKFRLLMRRTFFRSHTSYRVEPRFTPSLPFASKCNLRVYVTSPGNISTPARMPAWIFMPFNLQQFELENTLWSR